MATSPKSLDPRTLAKLSGLRLRARRIVEGYVAGLHRSPRHGFSIEFAEHREYAPGDDLRYLDWKVFGRTDKFYLKRFEDETNLVCHIVFDASESMGFRGPQAAISKVEYAACLAASLAWLVLKQQDAVGLVTYDQQFRDELPPSNRATHLHQVIDVLERCQPHSPTATGPILKQLAQRLQRRSVVILISDLLSDTTQLLAGLRALHGRRHDIGVLQIMDPAELSFPFDRPTRFRGLEQLADVVADPRRLRAAYLAELEHHLASVRRACRECEIDYCLIPTDEPLDRALTSFLSRRMARASERSRPSNS